MKVVLQLIGVTENVNQAIAGLRRAIHADSLDVTVTVVSEEEGDGEPVQLELPFGEPVAE